MFCLTQRNLNQMHFRESLEKIEMLYNIELNTCSIRWFRVLLLNVWIDRIELLNQSLCYVHVVPLAFKAAGSGTRTVLSETMHPWLIPFNASHQNKP